jgi:chromosomal replication initiation ATPase DnaA
MTAWSQLYPAKRHFSYAVSKEINAFLEIEAAKHGYTLAQLRKDDRTKAISTARQAVMVAAYATDKWGFITVGKALHRDHSTVVHAVQKARALAQQEAAA